jgi:hypothetical protein
VLGVLGIVVLALIRSTNRARVILVGVIFIASALPLSVDAFSIPEIGVQWIGRYGLPLLVGIPLVAAAVYDDRVRANWVGVAARTVVAVLFVTQAAVFYLAMRRYAVGTNGSSNPLTVVTRAQWTPPPGPAVVWWLLLTAALAVLAGVTLATADDRQTSADASAHPRRAAL